METGCISISILIAKGLNTYVYKVFTFFIFNKSKQKSKNLLSLCRYVVLCVEKKLKGLNTFQSVCVCIRGRPIMIFRYRLLDAHKSRY
jgi:hypothetical protein